MYSGQTGHVWLSWCPPRHWLQEWPRLAAWTPGLVLGAPGPAITCKQGNWHQENGEMVRTKWVIIPHHNSFLSSALPAWPGRGGVMLMTRCGPVSQDVTRRDETSQRTNSHKMTQYQLSPATRHSHQDQVTVHVNVSLRGRGGVYSALKGHKGRIYHGWCSLLILIRVTPMIGDTLRPRLISWATR